MGEPSQPSAPSAHSTVVVTGASGHLGTNLVRALLADGRVVRAVDRQWGPGLVGLPVERVTADVCCSSQMDTALEGAGVVIHLAANISIHSGSEDTLQQINVEGARSAAEAAARAGAARFVHCSSVHAYDLANAPLPITEQAPPASLKAPAYDRSKAAGQNAVRAALADTGVELVIVNPPGLIGPYDYKPSYMGQNLLTAARGRRPFAGPGGFVFADIRDVARGIMLAMRNGQDGHNYLLGGHWTSLVDLDRLAASLNGHLGPNGTVPFPLASLAAAGLEWSSRFLNFTPLFTQASLHTLRRQVDIDDSKAASELGYRCRPLDETISDSIQWWRANDYLD